MKHLGDITKINGLAVPPVDVITGGSPCQDLSVAGKRAGLDGERSGLFMEQIRIIKEMRSRYVRVGGSNQLVRLPRYCIWENVPGAFSSNGGKDFQAVLTEFARVSEPDAPDVPMPEKGRWPKAGCVYDDLGRWSIAWRVHDAQFWGVPQRRKRIALVADFGGLSAPEILFERKGLSGDPEPGRATREDTAGAARSGVESTGKCLNGWDVQSKHIQPADGIAESLYAGECRYGGGESYVMETAGAAGSGAGSASAVAVHLLQDPITAIERTPCISQGSTHCGAALVGVMQSVFSIQGNTIDRDAKQGGLGVQEGVSYTLDSVDRHGVFQCAEPILLESNQNHATVQTDGISTALPASMGMGGGYVPMVVGFKQGQGSKAGGIGAQEECAPTLSAVSSGTNQVPAVYDARGNGDGEIAPTMTGDHQRRVSDYTALCVGNGQLNQMSMAEQANTLDTMHDRQAVMVLNDQGGNVMDVSHDRTATLRAQSHGHEPTVFGSIVRRLTPNECAALQGFPRDWCNIGDWVDSKGKKHKDADSPKYKAYGNSIALPFWQYLARRICAQYERSITIASLFDGIGGFPLVFERCGAKAVWASEIEEFPIAVTKKHFPEEDIC